MCTCCLTPSHSFPFLNQRPGENSIFSSRPVYVHARVLHALTPPPFLINDEVKFSSRTSILPGVRACTCITRSYSTPFWNQCSIAVHHTSLNRGHKTVLEETDPCSLLLAGDPLWGCSGYGWTWRPRSQTAHHRCLNERSRHPWNLPLCKLVCKALSHSRVSICIFLMTHSYALVPV